MPSPLKYCQLIVRPSLIVALLFLSACNSTIELNTLELKKDKGSSSFRLAVIPDTQNYVDYTHQKQEGFAIDGSDLFIQQMQYIADNSVANGGDIAFVASVGDVWQHQTKVIDEEHASRGFEVEDNPIMTRLLKISDKALSVELPKAIEGYRLISDVGLPFGVAPGNHDHDAMWSAKGYPPNLNKDLHDLKMTPEDLGIMHIGGLDNFRSVFGENSDFFRGKPWYVASFNGGANSAQIFSAGGYRFLHIAIEMQARDEVVQWVESVLQNHQGLPTIITTHDYLNTQGQRLPNPIVDLARVDPEQNNSAKQMWEKLYSQHDQIFMVLCGHQHGQNFRVDDNVNGKPVYQILADYQDRGQVGLDAGQPLSRFSGKPAGIGDGWFRLMDFDLSAKSATVTVKTYSTYYKKYSGETSEYANWYKEIEQPDVSDEVFYQMDDYVISLDDFYARFSTAKVITK